MDASALAREISNLEKSWSALDWWLDFWTAVVVIGVAIELIVLIVEYVHDWRDFKRSTIRSPDRPSLLIYGVGFLGAALVAGGVAGELRIHTETGQIEAAMRSATRQLAAIAEREAASAEERATIYGLQAAKLRKQAEDERLERVKLEKQIAPRALTPSEIKIIEASLSPFASQFKSRRIKVSSSTCDTEGQIFSVEIADILSGAGIDVDASSIGRLMPVGLAPIGVNVSGPVSDKDFLSFLVTELHSYVDSDFRAEWNSKYTEVSILIGAKPVPGAPRIIPAQTNRAN